MKIVVRQTGAGREILILVVPDSGEEDEGRALGRMIDHFRYADDPGDPDDELYANAASPVADALDHLGPLATDTAVSRLAGLPVYHDETVPPGIVELRRHGETVGLIRI